MMVITGIPTEAGVMSVYHRYTNMGILIFNIVKFFVLCR